MAPLKVVRLRLLLPALLSLMMLFAAGLAGTNSAWAVTEKELQQARAERTSLQKRLNAAVSSYEASRDRYEQTQIQLAQSQRRLEEAEQELTLVQRSLTLRAVTTYKQGRVSFLSVLLEAESPSEFLRRVILLEKASASDSAVLLRAARARAEISDTRVILERQRAEHRSVVKQLQSLTSDLSQQFEAAGALESRLLAQKEEEERRRREAEARRRRAAQVARRASIAPGNFHCPIDGPHSFTDTWGDARSGGRRHQGVDIYAAHGARVVSVVDGTILRMIRSSLGGISLYVRGSDGSEYFYAHLAGYASITEGQRVSGGQLVAYNGNSGNARGGPAHVHFEIHPSGGAAINPYPTVRAACG